MREDIGNTEDLFGIASPVFSSEEAAASEKTETQQQDIKALAEVRVREKRWAVYVARAVSRFEKWWEACVPATLKGAPSQMLSVRDLTSKKGIDKIGFEGVPIRQLASKEYLPPVGEYGFGLPCSCANE